MLEDEFNSVMAGCDLLDFDNNWFKLFFVRSQYKRIFKLGKALDLTAPVMFLSVNT